MITKYRKPLDTETDNDTKNLVHGFANQVAQFICANAPTDISVFQILSAKELEELLMVVDEVIVDAYHKSIDMDVA